MHIHILGIAGQGMTTPLAVELKRLGHRITGSDQLKIYPPASNTLKKAKIPINSTPITFTINLSIIGSSFRTFPRTVKEFQEIQQQKIPYVSATEYIAKNLVKPGSILVAGAFGKTTITSLIAWILIQGGYHPNFMFGGKAINRIPSLHFDQSDWSVIEADESINGLDTKAKFLYYPAKYVILTSASWEHKESYPSAAKNQQAFAQLLKNIPPDGLLVYNPHDPSVRKILKFCHARATPYNYSLDFSTHLIGQHNKDNITAAYTLCHELNIPDSIIKPAIRSYRGIARRLQIIGNVNNILLIDDFAQSPPRVQSTLKAVKNTYPDRPLSVYFEPHATFLQNKSSLVGLNPAFSLAHEVVLSRLKFNLDQPKTQRVTASDYLRKIGPKAKYIPLDSDIKEYFVNRLKPKDILIHFSSGGLGGLNNLKKITRSLKQHV